MSRLKRSQKASHQASSASARSATKSTKGERKKGIRRHTARKERNTPRPCAALRMKLAAPDVVPTDCGTDAHTVIEGIGQAVRLVGRNRGEGMHEVHAL